MESKNTRQSLRLKLESVQLAFPLGSSFRIEVACQNCYFQISPKQTDNKKIFLIHQQIEVPYPSSTEITIRIVDKLTYKTYSQLMINPAKLVMPLQELVPTFHENSPKTLFARILLKSELSVIPDEEYLKLQDRFQTLTNEGSNTEPRHKRNWKQMLVYGLRPLLSSQINSLYTNNTFKKIGIPSSFDLKRYEAGFYIFGNDSDTLIYKFDFTTQKFSEIQPPFNLKLFCYSSATSLPNGQFVLAGGINKGFNLIVPCSFRYNPVTNTAQPLADMQQARYNHSSIYLSGYAYVIGGRYYGKAKRGVLASCERYNLTKNVWEPIANMIQERCATGVVVWAENIYAFGGFDGINRLKTIERYNPKINY